MHPIRIWDLPTRLFHWSLAACVIGLVITGNIGGNAMPWHGRLGYAVGTLVLFRLVWGVVGGRWSRFSQFVRGPGTVLAYLRGTAPAPYAAGHNPLGALSVLALLTVLGLQVASGLFADDEIAFTGPLTSLVSGSVVSLATGYHKAWGKLLLIALVGLHLAAIVYYQVRQGRNLVGPMISGDQVLPAAQPASEDGPRQRILALILLGLCAGAVAAVVRMGG